MSAQSSRAVFARAAAFCVALCAFGATAACREAPRGYRYLLPEGYVGWVRIDFGVAGAPPLHEEDGFHVIRVPPTGVIVTSSVIRTSPKRDEFFQESQRGRTKAGHLVAGFTSQTMESVRAQDDRVSFYAFFGTDEDWARATKGVPETQKPTPGWIEGPKAPPEGNPSVSDGPRRGQ